MKHAQNRMRDVALRQFAKRDKPDKDFAQTIEDIMDGLNPESENKIIILPEKWESKLKDWIDQADSLGNVKRKRDLTMLRMFFSLLNSMDESKGDILAKVEKVRELCRQSDSPTVQSFVLGSLGFSLISQGLTELSEKLTRDAIKAASQCGLSWAELKWSINLAVISMKESPEEAHKELMRLLKLARDLGDHNWIGMILNNLAYLTEKFLFNLDDAIRYQEEAAEIAHINCDKVSELKRLFHLANLQEKKGKISVSIMIYDRGLAIDSEIGLSGMGYNVFRHVSQLIATQYSTTTKEILATHIKNLPLNYDNIREMLEESKMGAVMSSWDSSTGSVNFTPDNSFAGELSLKNNWEALAVYARQWIEQGFLSGDNRGFYWGAVAFRSLGFCGIADEALQIGMILPKSFK